MSLLASVLNTIIPNSLQMLKIPIRVFSCSEPAILTNFPSTL